MVIFHSYVSLPEGGGQKNVNVWTPTQGSNKLFPPNEVIQRPARTKGVSVLSGIPKGALDGLFHDFKVPPRIGHLHIDGWAQVRLKIILDLENPERGVIDS